MKTALVLLAVLSTAMLGQSEANQVGQVQLKRAQQQHILRNKHMHIYFWKQKCTCYALIQIGENRVQV